MYVFTGEVKSADAPQVLISNAIGSCVVMVIYSKTHKMGIMSHIMLPGMAPANRKSTKNRYTINAIDNIFSIINSSNLSRDDFQIALIGGANVIPNTKHKIGESNIRSIKDYLQENNLSSKFESLGGNLRRSCRIYIEKGILYVTIGNDLKEIPFCF